MNKTYSRINWENYPSEKTALNETNLNKMDMALDEVDNRVIGLDTGKLDKAVANNMVKNVSYDEKTGIFTVTYLNGSTAVLDTKMEKLAINFVYDVETQQLIITLDDGTKQYVDLKALITEFEFEESDTITFIVTEGKVKANIKAGSITADMLEPNYLANVTKQAEIATKQAKDAESQANIAKSYAVGTDNVFREGDSTDNAKYYSEQAKASSDVATERAEVAVNMADNAHDSEVNAKTSENNASASADNAETSASNAQTSATNAEDSALIATSQANAAEDSKTQAERYANTAEENATISTTQAGVAREYAIGKTNSAKYYYEQAKGISEGLSGSLLPMGTISFDRLPDITTQLPGYMYNIVDEFVTTPQFKEGDQITVPAGSNVYVTADGYWDILSGTPVTGVKGANEETFRKGNVNITAENVGAVATGGDIAANTVTFTEASTKENIGSGETTQTIFGKIKKWFSSLHKVAFSGSYSDLSDIPTVQDNLTSTSTTNPLSANQGKVLKAAVDELNSNYVPKSGATLTNGGIIGANGDLWLNVDASDNTNNTEIKGLLSTFIANLYYKLNIVHKHIMEVAYNSDSEKWGSKQIEFFDTNGVRTGFMNQHAIGDGSTTDLWVYAEKGELILRDSKNAAKLSTLVNKPKAIKYTQTLGSIAANSSVVVQFALSNQVPSGYQVGEMPCPAVNKTALQCCMRNWSNGTYNINLYNPTSSTVTDITVLLELIHLPS